MANKYLTTSGHVLAGKEEDYVRSAIRGKVLTGGEWCDFFARSLANFLKAKYISLCNSGSSANLLALSALTSPKLKNRLEPGDRVITVAAGFPTTVYPIYQLGLVPIFVDVQIQTLNIEPSLLKETLQYEPKAMMIAHTLGNPFDVREVQTFCREHKLWLIEDCCDALGSTFEGHNVGSFGHFATFSFYPAHHITTGEGGAVVASSPRLHKILNSFRDWGRDCWCPPGKENTCGKRFDQEFEHLPLHYDHKYVYTHLGYNMKMTEMQAAIGCAQMERVAEWRDRRQRNFNMLHDGLAEYSSYLSMPLTHSMAGRNPFGFPITCKNTAPFGRADIVEFLEKHGVATRPVFGGNLTKQPVLKNRPMHIAASLERTELVANQTFWIGCWHGLKDNDIKYMLSVFDEFMEPFV